MNEQQACILLSHLTAFAQRAACAPVYGDEYLDHWGEIYAANHLRSRGILFEMFLRYPAEIMQAVGFGCALPLPAGETFYPLLPRQRAVQERLDTLDAAEARADAELARTTARPGPHVLEVPALHGDRLIQSMHPRKFPSHRKTGGQRYDG